MPKNTQMNNLHCFNCRIEIPIGTDFIWSKKFNKHVVCMKCHKNEPFEKEIKISKEDRSLKGWNDIILNKGE